MRVLGPPRLQNGDQGEEQKVHRTNETLNITARFVGFPKPNITWSFQKNTSFPNLTLPAIPVKKEKANIFSSCLEKPLLESDFGRYVAVASDENTAAYKVFDIHQQSMCFFIFTYGKN